MNLETMLNKKLPKGPIHAKRDTSSIASLCGLPTQQSSHFLNATGWTPVSNVTSCPADVDCVDCVLDNGWELWALANVSV